MTQAESKRSREIMAELRLQGWFCFKVHGSALMMSGLPDIIGVAEGYFFGLETKMELKRGNTSEGQNRVHDKIRKAGGFVAVVSQPAEAVHLVRTYIELQRSKS